MTQIPLKNPTTPAQAKAIGITQSPRAAPATRRVVQTFKGVINNHTIDVIDQSGDSTQYYKFLDHCQTCAWESRQNTLADAVVMAKMHVGL